MCRDRIDPADLAQAHDCRVTTAARTAWDLARRLDLVEAVVAVDALTRRAKTPGARGYRRLDRVVELAGYGWQTLRLGHNDPRSIHQTASKVRALIARRTPSAG